jgi:hypothetical protein
MEWMPYGVERKVDNELHLAYRGGIVAEILFRACDRPQEMKKFKSLEITGYWIDESIEVSEDVVRILKNRIGRFPKKCPVRFGIETTNPPDVEHPMYSRFRWHEPPPGPMPEGVPLPNHEGFWQPARENARNLRPGYYEDLAFDYRDNPDWAEIYIEGKPGIMTHGKLVYGNFRKNLHVADGPLVWSNGPLFRGWDNSGNCPACVVVQMPRAGHLQVLKEYHSDKMGIVDFTRYVVAECNVRFPGARFNDWGDPSGENRYSTKDGGFTSNAQLMREECKVYAKPSDQAYQARVQSVDQALGRIDGLLIDPGCVRLINGFLGGYCYSEIGNSGIFREKPDKNRFSHPHDALQYVTVKLVRSSPRSSLAGWRPRR